MANLVGVSVELFESRRLTTSFESSSPVYTSHAALFMCIMILLTSGFSVFTAGNWDPATFVSSYL